MIIQIAITALIAALIQGVLHWFPWRLVMRDDLPRTAAYTLGVLGFALPLTVLLWIWGLQQTIIALWAVIVASGAAVAGAYQIDNTLLTLARKREAAERAG